MVSSLLLPHHGEGRPAGGAQEPRAERGRQVAGRVQGGGGSALAGFGSTMEKMGWLLILKVKIKSESSDHDTFIFAF